MDQDRSIEEETNSQPAGGLERIELQQETFNYSEEQDIKGKESSGFHHLTQFHQKLTKREKFEAIMLCKKLKIKNLYSNQLEDEFEDLWIIDQNEQTSKYWNQAFVKISRAHCQALFFYKKNVNDFRKIMRSISLIEFKNLKTLGLQDFLISNGQCITFLDLPQLEYLSIVAGRLTNIKTLQKTNFKHIKQINLQNNFISEFNILPRVNIDKQKYLSLELNLIPGHIKCNLLCNTNGNERTGSNFIYKIESKFPFQNAVYNTIMTTIYVSTILTHLQILEEDNAQRLADIHTKECKHCELIIVQNKCLLKRWGLEMFGNLGGVQEKLRELR